MAIAIIFFMQGRDVNTASIQGAVIQDLLWTIHLSHKLLVKMTVVAVEIYLLSPQVFGLKLKTVFSLKIYCQSKGKYCSLMYTFVFTLSLTA